MPGVFTHMLNYQEELLDFDLPKDGYAVGGSAALAVRGIRENHDIDVLVCDDVWKQLCAQLHHPIDQEPIRHGHVEFWKCWPGLSDTEGVIEHADVIGGVRVFTLEDTVRWKQAMSRPKDIQDIHLIHAYLHQQERV